MHYVDIITAQKKQENPREDRKAVTFISYFLVLTVHNYEGEKEKRDREG